MSSIRDSEETKVTVSENALKTVGLTFRIRYSDDYWSPQLMFSEHLPPESDYKEVRLSDF